MNLYYILNVRASVCEAKKEVLHAITIPGDRRLVLCAEWDGRALWQAEMLYVAPYEMGFIYTTGPLKRAQPVLELARRYFEGEHVNDMLLEIGSEVEKIVLQIEQARGTSRIEFELKVDGIDYRWALEQSDERDSGEGVSAS